MGLWRRAEKQAAYSSLLHVTLFLALLLMLGYIFRFGTCRPYRPATEKLLEGSTVVRNSIRYQRNGSEKIEMDFYGEAALAPGTVQGLAGAARSIGEAQAKLERTKRAAGHKKQMTSLRQAEAYRHVLHSEDMADLEEQHQQRTSAEGQRSKSALASCNNEMERHGKRGRKAAEKRDSYEEKTRVLLEKTGTG